MLPSQFKALVEALRTELGAIPKVIREAIRNQNDAASDAKKAAEEKRRGPVRTVIVSGALGTVEELNAENSRKNKEYCQQERLIRWTKSAFIAAAIYAGIAAVTLAIFWGQLRTMNDTYGQIKAQTAAAQDQATLMRQELIGTMGAAMQFEPNIDDSAAPYVRLQWRNMGHMNTDLHVQRMSVDVIEIASGRALHLATFPDFEKLAIPPTPDVWQNSDPYPFSFSPLAGDRLKRGEIAIRFTGLAKYSDGFSGIIQTSFCRVDAIINKVVFIQGKLSPEIDHYPMDCNMLAQAIQSAKDWNKGQREIQQGAAQH
jgi:hypothetical protein